MYFNLKIRLASLIKFILLFYFFIVIMAKKKVNEKLRKKESDKRREKLKNDHVTKKEMQIKEHIKYLQKKRGQVKSVSEMTRRELKAKRKNWKFRKI